MDNFFEKQSESSKIKSEIVSKYFAAWANIVGARERKIAYFDFFCGQGKFSDGSPSTPLLVLNTILDEKKKLSGKVLTHFNDSNPDNIKSLESQILALDIGRLAFKPVLTCTEVDDSLAAKAREIRLIPSFVFFDPFGYKGISLSLIQSFLKDKKTDCCLFFNYLRINSAINNKSFTDHINGLFGPTRAVRMQEVLSVAGPNEREEIVITEFKRALKEIGGKCVGFKFKSAEKDRTSHYLFIISKHQKGYDLAKDIMANISKPPDSEVGTFEFDPKFAGQFGWANQIDELEELRMEILEKFAGRQVTATAVYEEHNESTPYILRNYKKALGQLFTEQKIDAFDPDGKWRRGKTGFPPRLVYTLPRR